jgi:hypothetical protein
MIAQKLFAIVASIVQFDRQGTTNVKLANFRQDVLHISPGQRISSIELLSRDPLLTTLKQILLNTYNLSNPLTLIPIYLTPPKANFYNS